MKRENPIRLFANSRIRPFANSPIRLFANSVTVSRPGFSLFELIVVIGIIAILVGVLIGSFGGGIEAARAAKCLSNMRNLAVSWSGGRAGSQEHLAIEVQMGGGAVRNSYYEEKGWISSDTQGLYPSQSHQTFSPIGLYEKDRTRIDYAITNGWMYSKIGRDDSSYVCPVHAKKKAANGRPGWSYLMNAYFGWDSAQGDKAFVTDGCVSKTGLTSADRLLLFAEIPFQGVGDWFPDDTGGSTDTDAILQYVGCDKAPTVSGSGTDGNENIGGNHKTGKRWCAHVAFADGHTEKLVVQDIESSNLKELTTWLCTGKPVSRNNTTYEELK